jgi:hypothetical protein
MNLSQRASTRQCDDRFIPLLKTVRLVGTFGLPPVQPTARKNAALARAEWSCQRAGAGS